MSIDRKCCWLISILKTLEKKYNRENLEEQKINIEIEILKEYIKEENEKTKQMIGFLKSAIQNQMIALMELKKRKDGILKNLNLVLEDQNTKIEMFDNVGTNTRKKFRSTVVESGAVFDSITEIKNALEGRKVELAKLKDELWRKMAVHDFKAAKENQSEKIENRKIFYRILKTKEAAATVINQEMFAENKIIFDILEKEMNKLEWITNLNEFYLENNKCLEEQISVIRKKLQSVHKCSNDKLQNCSNITKLKRLVYKMTKRNEQILKPESSTDTDKNYDYTLLQTLENVQRKTADIGINISNAKLRLNTKKNQILVNKQKLDNMRKQMKLIVSQITRFIEFDDFTF